jgi:hypothetical protein
MRPMNQPDPPEVPPAGFGYPLDGVSYRSPWKPLSAPNAPGLRPSELSSSPGIERMFPPSLPLLRFPNKPLGLLPALQRLHPPGKAVLLVALECLVRVGGSALLGLRPRGLSLRRTSEEASPFSSPLSSFESNHLSMTRPRNPRVLLSAARRFLPKKAPARRTFRTICIRYPLKE